MSQYDKECRQQGVAAAYGILGHQIKRADREVSVAQVIITRNLQRGDGTPERPLRSITQVWSMDGELIAERDPLVGFGETVSAESEDHG